MLSLLLNEDSGMVEFWEKIIKEALYLVHKVWNLILHQNIMWSWRKLYVGLEMDDDANPFSGFEEEGDDQFLKEMMSWSRKKLSLTRLMKKTPNSGRKMMRKFPGTRYTVKMKLLDP